MGRSLPLNHFRIKPHEKGNKRCTLKRAPRNDEKTAVVEDAEMNRRGGQGVGRGRESSVDTAGTILPHILMALKLFAEDDGKVHTVYCLKEDDVAFNAGERQVEG